MLALEELLGAFLEEEDMNLLLDQNLEVIALELERNAAVAAGRDQDPALVARVQTS